MVILAQLSSMIELSGEYIEDPTHIMAKNDQGKFIRMKLKLSLSYRGAAESVLKNIQVQLNLPPNVYSEQTTFKFPELNFGRSATPPVL